MSLVTGATGDTSLLGRRPVPRGLRARIGHVYPSLGGGGAPYIRGFPVLYRLTELRLHGLSDTILEGKWTGLRKREGGVEWRARPPGLEGVDGYAALWYRTSRIQAMWCACLPHMDCQYYSKHPVTSLLTNNLW